MQPWILAYVLGVVLGTLYARRVVRRRARTGLDRYGNETHEATIIVIG